MRSFREVLIWGMCSLGCSLPAQAAVYLTLQEALDQTFPDAQIKKETVYLTKEQRTRIEELSNTRLKQDIFFVYHAARDGKPVGTAYFDKHLVRTLPEILMVSVAPDGSVQNIKVLAFSEPREYLPVDKWYRQFNGKTLSKELRLQREIDGITGATLTARATTRTVRVLLAVHQVLNEAVPDT